MKRIKNDLRAIALKNNNVMKGGER